MTEQTRDPAQDERRWPAAGDKMRFLGKNGYPDQLKRAMKAFEVGAEYEVEACDVGDWSHSVRFKGVEGWHNGVMFEMACRSPAGCGTPGCADPDCNYANEPGPPIANDLVERLRNPMWAHSNAPFPSPQLEQEENIAAMNEAAAALELLSNPAAVHLNMLTGGIAKPSLANIKHLYPEVEQAFSQVESVREQCAKVCDDRAAYFDRAKGHRDWNDAARSYRATAAEIRCLPNPSTMLGSEVKP